MAIQQIDNQRMMDLIANDLLHSGVFLIITQHINNENIS